MASKKTTIKGRGPEIFGRGIDLLFGEAQKARQGGRPTRLQHPPPAILPARRPTWTWAALPSPRPPMNTCAWLLRPFL